MNDEVQAQTFVDRMVDELNELDDKMHKLRNFIKEGPFKKLESVERVMLLLQCDAMQNYRNVLNARLEYYVHERTPV